MTSRSKKLNLEEIKKIDKRKYSQVEKIEVNGYTISIDKEFKPTKITALLREATNLIEETIENNLNVGDTVAHILSVLLIKYFTDVSGIPEGLSGILSAMDLMIDNGFLKEIIGHMDVEEMKKVNQQLSNVISGIDMFNTGIEMVKENPELVNKLTQEQ